MTAITMEAVKAKQAELAAMIEKLQAQAEEITLLTIPEASIELRAGEHYAGTVLDADGNVRHHLVLMAETPASKLNWNDAKAWAESVGGALPNRQEQALLFANCKPHLEPAWHWSSQEYESDAAYAWHCYFGYGNQNINPKSYEGCARAVRRA
jgi:hypothetical protein